MSNNPVGVEPVLVGRVGQNGERKLELPGKLEQPVPGLKRDRHHAGAHGLNLAMPLPQLRQVLPSRDSSEMSQED